MLLLRRGLTDAALEQWRVSLSINPAQPDILNNLGAVAMQVGDKEQAIAYWQRALEYAPDAPILLQNLAAAQATP